MHFARECAYLRTLAPPVTPAPISTEPSPNFAYLAFHDPKLAALGTRAEAHFAGDPAATLAAQRVFGELLA